MPADDLLDSSSPNRLINGPARLTVQKELMRHASIQTTMNIYGKAMTDSKRQAHSKVVEMVLNSRKSDRNRPEEPVAG